MPEGDVLHRIAPFVAMPEWETQFGQLRTVAVRAQMRPLDGAFDRAATPSSSNYFRRTGAIDPKPSATFSERRQSSQSEAGEARCSGSAEDRKSTRLNSSHLGISY